MTPVEIGAIAVGAIFLLVAAGRLLASKTTVDAIAGEARLPGGAVGLFVAAVNRCGSEEDPEYRTAVAALRSDSTTAATIEAAYWESSAELKPSLLLAAGAAGPAARSFLARIASSPPEKRHRVAAAVAESRLRLMAMDGLEKIARAGDEAAWRDLEQLGLSEDRAVQVGAVAALKFGEQDEALERLRAQLPQGRWYVFDVKRPDVRDVPQITDPRRHLRGLERTADRRPHPEWGAPDGQEGRRRRKGAPGVVESKNG